MWLWRVHNSVTARVARESNGPLSVAWPSSVDCGSCWPVTASIEQDLDTSGNRKVWARRVKKSVATSMSFPAPVMIQQLPTMVLDTLNFLSTAEN